MKLIKYIAIVLITFIVITSLINYVYEKGFNKYYATQLTKLDEVLNGGTNYDILFLGSSRTYVHIDPKIIDSVTGLRSYNGGVDGANLLEMEFVLNAYLDKHTPPKLVVVDLAKNAFDIEGRPFFNSGKYFSFLHNKHVADLLRPYKRVEVLRWAPFFRLAEADDYTKTVSIYGLMGKQETPISQLYKGYMPNGSVTMKPNSAIDTSFYPVNKSGTDILNSMIALCRKQNIRLVLTYAPEYQFTTRKNNPKFFPLISQLATGNGIDFRDYRDLNLCKQHELFANPGHLNQSGASLYTTIVGQEILSWLKIAELQGKSPLVP